MCFFGSLSGSGRLIRPWGAPRGALVLDLVKKVQVTTFKDPDSCIPNSM
jgi:hypothetical protein